LSIRTEVLDELPDKAKRSGRESVCQEIVDLAIAQTPKYVKVDSDDTAELTKVYKSMIQYRARHAARVKIDLRKVGDALYVWIADEAGQVGA